MSDVVHPSYNSNQYCDLESWILNVGAPRDFAFSPPFVNVLEDQKYLI